MRAAAAPSARVGWLAEQREEPWHIHIRAADHGDHPLARFLAHPPGKQRRHRRRARWLSHDLRTL